MRTFWIAAAVGLSLIGSTGMASADPWKDESGHGRHGGKHWKFDDDDRGRGRGWGHHRRMGYDYGRPRGYGYYEERRSYRRYGYPY